MLSIPESSVALPSLRAASSKGLLELSKPSPVSDDSGEGELKFFNLMKTANEKEMIREVNILMLLPK